VAAKSPEPCNVCSQGANAGTWPPPERIAVYPNGPTFLHRCHICGTYWDFDLRSAAPITAEEAESLYPDYFSTGGSPG
jgi:hypothetical protein